jgi:hypothetical protein
MRTLRVFSTFAAGGLGFLTLVAFEPAMAPQTYGVAPPLARYAGVYNAGFLDVTIALRADGVLTSSARGFPGNELVAAGRDQFALQHVPGYRLEFFRDEHRAVLGLILHKPGGSYAAVRKTEHSSVGALSLSSLPGIYMSGGFDAVIALRADGVLTASVPGRAPSELLPDGELTFTLRDMPGYRLEFRLGERDQVLGVISSQPNGSFAAVRKVVAKPLARSAG